MTGAAVSCRRAGATLAAVLADPSARPDPHVADCDTCESVVRDALAFERSLRNAASALVVEPLPPVYRVLAPRRFASHGSASPERSGRVRLGLRAAASVAGVLAIVAVVASSGALGPNRHGAAAGSGHETQAPSTLASPASTPASGLGGSASVPLTGATDACRSAFGGWMKAWDEAGRSDYTGGSPIRGSERGAAIEAFGSCTLDELRTLNEASTVVRLRNSVKTEDRFIGAFDRTVPIWCVLDGALSPTGACRGAFTSNVKQSFHVIQPGDTMSAIASSLGLSLDALLAENPQISNPDRILAGDVLLLPSPSGTPASPSP